MNATTQSPVQKVRKDFESKQKLVDQLISKLSRPQGESTDEFRKRLLRVSCAKLLALHNRVWVAAKGSKKPS